MLMKKGGDINLVNRDGVTALHIAAEKSHLDVLEVLLKNDASVRWFRWCIHLVDREVHDRTTWDFN